MILMTKKNISKRVTLHDVAQAAGVTHTTVSLVLKGKSRISKETEERVKKCIKDLNYRPNKTAQRLAGGKNNTIAVVASFFSSYFELEILRGMQMAIGSYKYNLNQYTTQGKKKAKEDLFYQILDENLAEGVICLNLKPSKEIIEVYNTRSIPVILIEEEMEGSLVIRTNNFEGSYKATDHLISCGYKNIALLNGAITGEETGISPKERFDGYCAALGKHNIPLNDSYVYETEDYEIGDGYKLLEQIINEHPEVDAIFCAAGDMVAFGMMKYAKNNKIKIPEEIAIIGYDDHFAAEIVYPPLTTVSQPIFSMGHTSITTLVKAMKGEFSDISPKTIFSPVLKIRETC